MIEELVVVDASTVLAGPSVGSFFAELGATVIKVEHPNHPDITRSWKLSTENSKSTVSAYFSSINYHKEFIQLDLSDRNDHNSFLELIKKADILISNFKKGDDKKFNITDEFLHSINPSLISAKINGYGSKSDRVAYDLILQAESGFMSMNGTENSGPVKMPVALIDVLAAHHLKEGILVSLLERVRTGKGTSIQVSLYDAAVSSLVNQASNYLMEGKIAQRIGSKHPNIAPYGEIFITKDKIQVTFAIGSNKHFKLLCEFLELNHVPEDEKFNTNQKRVINRIELFNLLNEKVKKLYSEDLLSYLEDKNVPAGKIKSIDEVFDDESAQSLILEEVIDGVNTKRIKSVLFK